jgi:hypothetical protein
LAFFAAREVCGTYPAGVTKRRLPIGNRTRAFRPSWEIAQETDYHGSLGERALSVGATEGRQDRELLIRNSSKFQPFNGSPVSKVLLENVLWFDVDELTMADFQERSVLTTIWLLRTARMQQTIP